MLRLSLDDIEDTSKWKDAGIELPGFDINKVKSKTISEPEWLHFGSGNIFKAFIADLQQDLLNQGFVDKGIIAAESFDLEIIDKIYKPYDNLSLLVTMHPDGQFDKKIIASVVDGLKADKSYKKDWERLKDIFKNKSLKMVSFTVTEKGYKLEDMDGKYFDFVKEDFKNGLDNPNHAIAIVAALAYERFKEGQYPIAFASMDNCSNNGQKLHESMETIIKKWIENGHVEEEFLNYINDETKVSFPWSMIDKITPRPSVSVKEELEEIDFKDNDIIQTDKNTFIAPFVNSEVPGYLVIEDSFPNGKIPLDKTGVIYTDRETVNKVEKMKVTTCLNPLHTAMAVYGCLLGHNLIADEMKDNDIYNLITRIGYQEGLPVVVDPGVLNPKEFIDEVVKERLTNPYIPDTPQRIATDTSQKIAIRFGETIKSYRDNDSLNPEELIAIPLAIAGWLRYLLGIDDSGKEMDLSPDPLIDELTNKLEGIKFGEPVSVKEQLKPILSNEDLMGLDLYEVNLGNKIESYFKEMIQGSNAVRSTLKKYL